MTEKTYNVLFLCTGNSARSIIAEAILNHLGRGRFKAYSAGSHPKGGPHPYAIDLLRKLDFDVEGLRSKSWDEFAGPEAPPLDFVFTLCDDAASEQCPHWPGQPMTAHWGMPILPRPKEARSSGASHSPTHCECCPTEFRSSQACPSGVRHDIAAKAHRRDRREGAGLRPGSRGEASWRIERLALLKPAPVRLEVKDAVEILAARWPSHRGWNWSASLSATCSYGLAAGDIARLLAIPQNTLSNHLSILQRAGLVNSRREGRSIIYAANKGLAVRLAAFLLEDCCDASAMTCDPAMPGHGVKPFPVKREADMLQQDLQCSGDLHGQFRAIDHGGGDTQQGRRRAHQGVFGRKPSKRPTLPDRDRAAQGARV